MAKKDKNELYSHIELGIYKGISFKLVIPSKKNKEKYPNYYIQYDGSKKHYVGVKSIYLDFISLELVLQNTESLIELYIVTINDIILPTLREQIVIENRVKITDLVTNVINRFFINQSKQFESGELVDISDYSVYFSESIHPISFQTVQPDQGFFFLGSFHLASIKAA